MTKAKNASVIAALVAVSLFACNEEKAKPEPTQPSAVGPTTPSFAPIALVPAAERVSGTVAETMDAAGYTYLRITTANGEKWAAVLKAKVLVGDKVTIVNATVMKSFASPTLKRTFDEILFGTLEGSSAGTPLSIAMPSARASVTASASSNAPIAKAAGPTGRTIAEVFAGKTTLEGKPVVVRGRVTKFNAGILSRNWIHIVDGTGSKATSDNDLTVTTQGDANVGDVIVVRGVLHLDKDFGGGYSYALIIEDATLEK